MESDRFDALIQLLTHSRSRRHALTGLLGGVLAGVTGLDLSEVAAKRRKHHKRRNRRKSKKHRAGVEITDGTLDGENHPYVGLMSAHDKDGKHLWRCSGTLLSPTLFLTAGHCVEAPATRAEIWFAADVEHNMTALNYPNKGETGGTPHTHPNYNPAAFYLYDLGVVVLDKPVQKATYGALPGLNQLDELAKKRGEKDVTFTAVGYGLQQAFPDAAAWKEEANRVRMVATPHLVQINSAYTGDFSLLLSNNANTGGTCFGDSGGPNFIGSSNVIGGVTSYGNNDTCAGTGGVYRVDRADDLNWLATFGLKKRR
jgi:secreted trypsin-like serine protease